MPFAREVSAIAVFLEELGNRRRLLLQAILVTWGDDDRQPRADGDSPGDERRTAGSATCLAVPAGEQRAFLGNAIDIWGRMTQGRSAASIRPEIVPACVV